MVKHVGDSTTASSFVRNVLETGGGEICEENLPTTRWLLPNVLREIADGHVHRVCGLAAKDGELSLVRGNDDRNDCCPGLLLLELLLMHLLGQAVDDL